MIYLYYYTKTKMEENDMKGQTSEEIGVYINGINYSYLVSKSEKDKEKLIIKLYDETNKVNIYYTYSYLNGDWGLGIGDWGLGIGPNPQSPIPNPQSPKLFYFNLAKIEFMFNNIFHKKIYINGN